MTNAPWTTRMLIGLAVCAACDRSKDGGAAAGLDKLATGGVTKASDGPPVVAAWNSAGLTVSALTKDSSGAVGSDCTSGTVSGVDVVLCTFASEKAAKDAEASGLSWVGEATGASIASSSMILAVADRRNADPSGRTMNKIINTFREQRTKP